MVSLAMTEPDVTLTDYAVALESAILAGLLPRRGAARPDLRRLFVLFFASAGLGALAGGTVHGFFPDDDSLAAAVLWRVTLLALGVTAFTSWSIGARLVFAGTAARVVQTLAALELAAYAVVVIVFDHRFLVAIANYAPAVAFLALSFLVVYRRQGGGPLLAGLAGLLLTAAAAVVQRRRIALHPAYFDHNALYHVIQMVAFVLIWLAGRYVITAPAAAER
jgi:hypothetical protein